MNSGSGTLRLKQSAVWFDNVRIARDEGTATGSFTFNLLSRKLEQCQGEAHLQPAAVATWFEPSLLPVLEHFRFSQPPDLTLHSSDLNGRTELFIHMETASELVYRCGFLEVPLTSAQADVIKVPDKISFSIPDARLGDGQCSISAQLVPPNRIVDSEVHFDRVSLADVRIRSAFISGWEGLLTGSLRSRFDAGDSALDSAEGKFVLAAVDFSKPRFIEAGFKKLAAAGFNRIGQLEIEFATEPGVININRLSLASGNHLIDLSGALDLRLGVVQLLGHLDQDAAFSRVTGIVTDPDWEIEPAATSGAKIHGVMQ